MDIEIKKKKLAASISAPIIKAHRAGVLTLSLVLCGTMLLVAALATRPDNLSSLAAVAGVTIIIAVLARFYFVDIRTMRKLNETIKDNEDFVNAIQDTAIQMTELSSHLQALAFTQADKISPLLAKLKNHVGAIAEPPLADAGEIGNRVAQLTDHREIKEAQKLSRYIFECSESARETIEDIRIALLKLDPEPIERYRKHIQELDHELKNVLKEKA